jgi:oligosaccharide repeat unit polymerase
MKIKAFLTLIVSVILYIFAPSKYDYTYCVILFVLFVFDTYFIILDDIRHKFYFSFNIIFSLSFFLTSFAYPVFLYHLDDINLFGLKQVNENVIVKSTALAQLSFSLYSFAYIMRYESKSKYKKQISPGIAIFRHKNVKNILNILFIFSLLFFLYDYITLLNTAPGSVINIQSSSIFLITIFSLIIIVVYFFMHKNEKISIKKILKNNKLFFVGIFILFVFLFLIGDRGPMITVGTILIAAYIYYVKRVSVKILLPLVLFVIVVLFLIGQTRGSDSYKKSLISSITKQDRQDNRWNYLSDLTSISRNLYNGYEYRMNNELLYPEKIIVIVSSPIPYMPTFLSNLFFDKSFREISSSAILTNYGFNLIGIEGIGGLGTHCVSDIFMSWGIIGIFIFFYLFGYLIAFTQNRLSTSIYSALFYFSFLALATSIPRGSIFDGYNLFARVVIVFLIIVFLFSRKKESFQYNF